MAIDSASRISFYLSLPVEHKDYLGAIRHWDNLKMAYEEDTVWVKDLSFTQANSIEVKSIPYKELYYSSGPKLFPKGSLLPSRSLPSLLWTPIERGLPVILPAFNHNFFGITDKSTINLVLSDKETEAFALLVKLNLLQDYILTAPTIRLQHLQWTIIESSHALITGLPLLPLQGEVFWQREQFLLPAGYDLALHALSNELNQLLNPGNDAWILWQKNATYLTISQKLFTPLSISSFRLSKERGLL